MPSNRGNKKNSDLLSYKTVIRIWFDTWCWILGKPTVTKKALIQQQLRGTVTFLFKIFRNKFRKFKFNIILYLCSQVPLSRTDKTPRMNASSSSALADCHHTAQGKRGLCKATLLGGKWADLESPSLSVPGKQILALRENILLWISKSIAFCSCQEQGKDQDEDCHSGSQSTPLVAWKPIKQTLL